jgi:hypothetical protein
MGLLSVLSCFCLTWCLLAGESCWLLWVSLLGGYQSPSRSMQLSVSGATSPDYVPVQGFSSTISLRMQIIGWRNWAPA